MTWISKPVDQLLPEELASWRSFLARNPAFKSPFFRPEYTQTAAQILPNVEVGLLISKGVVVAIWPFERDGRRALPVGRSLADYQGVIRDVDTHFDPHDMLRQLNLSRWDFDHLVAPNESLKQWCWTDWDSHQIEMPDGFEAYQSAQFKQHKDLKKKIKRTTTRLPKELGDLQLLYGDQSTKPLLTLIDWKIRQYEASGREHPFRQSWAQDLLCGLMNVDSPDFRAITCALLAGKTATAIEYLLISGNVAHSLVSAYDVALARFGPGTYCQLKTLEACDHAGIHVYDMGKGLETYKQKASTGSVPLAEGAVDLVLPRAIIRSTAQRFRYQVLRSRWSKPIKQAARLLASRFPSLRNLLGMR